MLKTSLALRPEPFEYRSLEDYDLQTVQKDGKRFYDVNGEFLPSVTTVLSSMVKEGLLEWRKKVGEAEAEKIMRLAANRGTKVHKMCEDYLRNDPAFAKGYFPDSIRMFKQIQPWLDKNVEFIYGNEIALFSRTLKSAGRCDLVAQVNGAPAIIDFKTSTKAKRADWIENYYMQVTAYAIMLYEMYGIVAKKAYILVTLEEEDFLQEFPIFIKDYHGKTVNFFKQYHQQNS